MPIIKKVTFLSGWLLLILLFQNCGGQEASKFFSSESTVDDNAGVDTDPSPANQAELKGVIFQTDFSEDTGYSQGNTGVGWIAGGPKGWDGIRIGKTGVVSVESNAGVNGKNALKLKYGPDPTRTSLSLGKHLTGDIDVGYKEVFVRYTIKLPNNFKAGSGSPGPFWKWGRLWQNTTPKMDSENNWSEKRRSSGYVVFGINSSFRGQQSFSSMWADSHVEGKHEEGSAGGPSKFVDWYYDGRDVPTWERDGYWESVGEGAWKMDPSGSGFFENRNQEFHTIEWHFKLSSDIGVGDGVFELFLDGVRQSDPSRLVGGNGAPPSTGIPTTPYPSGFNHLTVFDNLQSWAADWGQAGVDGYILLNDIVVSTERIGHEYTASGYIDSPN